MEVEQLELHTALWFELRIQQHTAWILELVSFIFHPFFYKYKVAHCFQRVHQVFLWQLQQFCAPCQHKYRSRSVCPPHRVSERHVDVLLGGVAARVPTFCRGWGAGERFVPCVALGIQCEWTRTRRGSGREAQHWWVAREWVCVPQRRVLVERNSTAGIRCWCAWVWPCVQHHCGRSPCRRQTGLRADG